MYLCIYYITVIRVDYEKFTNYVEWFSDTESALACPVWGLTDIDKVTVAWTGYWREKILEMCPLRNLVHYLLVNIIVSGKDSAESLGCVKDWFCSRNGERNSAGRNTGCLKLVKIWKKGTYLWPCLHKKEKDSAAFLKDDS
jgi:hypothetical protein